MSVVLLGLGANLGDPLARLREAVERLGRVMSIEAVSSVYRTEPLGYADQPAFLNLVCRARTDLSPDVVLHAALEIERRMGRVRLFPNAPRSIDIDLLAYDDRVVDEPGLTLPHPRLHERAFVLVPLQEVAPEWRHPVLGSTAGELLAGGGATGGVERLGALDDWRSGPGTPC